MREFGITRPADTERFDDHWRSEFDVDADRILYAPEFRRLAGVTQVISPQDDYVFHDRLTHSLKVGQVAESLAKSLVAQFVSEGKGTEAEAHEQLHPKVCYVAGLAHDIGHPPFGHAAEVQLQEELRHGRSTGGVDNREILADSFEGNAQSFRIVSKLSFRKDERLEPKQDGLNLTWRSLAAISKYPWLKGEHPHTVQKLENKWGFYNTEAGYADHLLATGKISRDGKPPRVESVRRTVEAEVMDWADDIAYAVHDLEDFYRSGRVALDRIKLTASSKIRTAEWKDLFTFSSGKILKVPELASWSAEDLEKFLLNHIIPALPGAAFTGSRQSHASLQAFSSAMIRRLQDECHLEIDSQGRMSLSIHPKGLVIAEFLKSITQYYVIHDTTVETMQMGQRLVVSQLFLSLHQLSVDAFLDKRHNLAAQRRLPARLKDYAQLSLDTSEAEAFRDDEGRLARAVIDFLCSLTDKQAGFLHQRITGDAVARLSPYWLNL